MISDSEAPSDKRTKIRILIADGQVIVLEGLAAIIDRQPDMTVVAEASDCQRAFERWVEHRPDVTLSDFGMSNLDRISVLERIRKEDRSARVIVLTIHDTEAEVVRVIRAGAKGYLRIDARREELLDCIRRVHQGEICIAAALVEKVAASLNSECLTRREIKVLELLAQGKSNKELAVNLGVSEMTVKSHLKNIFRKLNVFSRMEAILIASRRGIIRL